MANLPNLSVVRDPGKPKKLGRYEFEECLGAEGSRETYRARVKGLAGFDRIFALKSLRRRGNQPMLRTDPFVLAAKRMTSVIDPRIARVLDADVIDGAGVAVTEYVHGLDLDRFREWAQVSGELATGGDPAAQKWQQLVAYVGRETAAALAALHAQTPPIVHGALSPRNVIVTSRGGIKLLDAGLGVGAQKGGDPPSARAAAYAAPAPPGAEPTTASDVRALGAMLFELVTGELPAAGTTSAAARRTLESVWPAGAELVGNMLAEDPALRPRASHVAEALGRHLAEVPEATMAGELAGLVRNFSAFVADGPQSTGVVPNAPAAVPAESAFPSGSSGVLPVAIPPPAAPRAPTAAAVASGSFLAVSDAETRVSPEGGGYANAIFKALPAEEAPPAAPAPPAAQPIPVVRATLGPPIGRPTLRSFSAMRPPEPAVVKAAAATPLPPRQASLPVLPVGPLAKGAASPTLPPLPAAASSRGAGLRLASPLAATIAFAPERPAVPPVASVSEPVLEATAMEELAVEPEAMAETVDWGAQALAALGTQAGVSIALLPVPGDVESNPGLAAAPPPADEPGLEPAFAFAPQPPPPAESWGEPQPGSQGMLNVPGIEDPALAPAARQELLEEELLDEEQTPLLVPTGNLVAAAGEEPDLSVEAGFEDQEAEAVEPATDAGRAPLEATAFVPDEQPAAEPEQLGLLEGPPDEMAALEEEETPRRPRARNALRTKAEQGGDDEAEPVGPAPSRTKKIVLVLAAAAALGAGAAALTLGLGKRSGPAVLVKAHVLRSAATSSAAGSPLASKGPVAAAAARAGKTDALAVTDKASAGKLQAAARAASAEPAVVAGKGQPEAARVNAKAAPGAIGKAQGEVVAVTAKPKVAGSKMPAESAASGKPTAGDGVLAAPSKAAERTPTKLTEPVAVKPTPELAAASTTPAPGGSVRVRVASQPDGARAWIDGEERGQTPFTIALKRGTARVVLVHAGYLTSQSMLEVRDGAGVDEKLKPVQPPMTGEARFRAECQTQGKLPIVVDGKETGILCPFSKMRVDPGPHSIGLLIPASGQIHQKEVTLSAGVRSVVFGD